MQVISATFVAQDGVALFHEQSGSLLVTQDVGEQLVSASHESVEGVIAAETIPSSVMNRKPFIIHIFLGISFGFEQMASNVAGTTRYNGPGVVIV